MTIDPSGKGTTGICLIIKKYRPEIIVYETTNYIHKRIPGTLTLLKLIGGIVGIKYTFDFVKQIDSIAVNQVKPFKDKLFTGREQLENLTCEAGRGKGWKYKQERISLHQLDALVIYHL
ncbi:6815_t:CDS:2 [Funneliformis geosporum]|uniref:6815_t:CDS:1 n=1 Tax=Funneliformis geosporum TaxID=1117311 RepID=A0A9W4SB64_9GLOM|nr:6815_t:CDS:2 [Funneliformis geosporum]